MVKIVGCLLYRYLIYHPSGHGCLSTSLSQCPHFCFSFSLLVNNPFTSTRLHGALASFFFFSENCWAGGSKMRELPCFCTGMSWPGCPWRRHQPDGRKKKDKRKERKTVGSRCMDRRAYQKHNSAIRDTNTDTAQAERCINSGRQKGKEQYEWSRIANTIVCLHFPVLESIVLPLHLNHEVLVR